jgi:hypothetical protein
VSEVEKKSVIRLSMAMCIAKGTDEGRSSDQRLPRIIRWYCESLDECSKEMLDEASTRNR